MNKKVILAVLIIITGFSLKAQITQNMSDQGMVIFTKEKEPDTFTGSPYVEKEFKKGTIHDQDGRSLEVFLRYNALEDVVVIKTEEDSDEEYMLPKLKKITYELDDYTYFIDNIETSNGNIEAYFAKYYEGPNSSFIVRQEIDYTPPQKAKTGYEEDKPANIDIEKVYYLKVGDGKYEDIRRLKGKFFEDFFDSKRMKEYFKNNKVKSEKEVVEMLQYYDQN